MESRTRARDVLSLLMQRLAEAGVTGLSFGEPRDALAENGEAAGLRIAAEAAIPYDRPGDARTIVARAFAASTFLDLEAFSLTPVKASKSFVTTLDFVAFDPFRALRSNVAQRALEQSPPTGWWNAADGAVRAAVAGFVAENPAWKETLDRRLLVTRVAYGGDEEEWAKVLEPLPDEVRLAIEDARGLAELRRSQEFATGAIDEWIHEREIAVGGEKKGRFHVRGVWLPVLGRDGDSPRGSGSSGGNDIAEVGGDTAGPSLEELVTALENEALDQTARMDALRVLAMTGDRGRSLGARALAFDALRLNALVFAPWAELQPLFREIAFTRDPDRAGAALDCLRGWRRSFDDPRRAWSLSEGMPSTSPNGSLYQEAILRDYAMTGDRSSIPALIAGIADATRPESWRRAALHALHVFEAAEAAPEVLRIALQEAGVSGDPLPFGFADEAMQFFSTIAYPPAKPLLVRGMRTDSLCSAFAISALALLGDDGVALIAEEAERMARTTYEGETTWPRLTASTLVRELVKKRRPDRTLPVSEATLRALGRFGPDIAEAVEAALAPPAAEIPKGADEADVRGATPRETYDLRRERWLEPGYAEARYLASGHRGAWDAVVIAAHRRYTGSANPATDTSLRDEYAKAMELGCRDGMVAYRDAVVRVFAGEPLDEARFRNAAEWMPAQYPHSPYLSSAWVKVAESARKAGRMAEALAAARRSVDGDAHDPDARRVLDELEASEGAASRARTLPALGLGSLVAVPSLWHAGDVRSVHVSPDGRHVVSADSRGDVQVSSVIPSDYFPRLVPDVREPLHAKPARARWTSNDTFVSAGSDGAVCVVRVRPGEPFEVRRVPPGREADELSRAIVSNPDRAVDPAGDWVAALQPHGGIDVSGLRGGRGTMASAGSLGRYVIFDACFPHRLIACATDYKKLGMLTWGN